MVVKYVKHKPEPKRERNQVAKHVELVSRKAAIVFDVPVP